MADKQQLPWFKFTPNDWLTGSITGEDMCSQGLFINICAYYWKEGGSVPINKIERRYGKFSELNLLKKEYLKISEDGIVNIKFLDEQLEVIDNQKVIDSENGKKGAEKRWGGHRGAINGQWPNIADIDIDIDKEKEKEYTSASPVFSESGKKPKLDAKVGKAVKKLDDSGDISLVDVEERFFAGRGTMAVIQEFQAFFSSIGYAYKSDQGVKTVFMSWVNQMKQDAMGKDIDKKSIPFVKSTESLESDFAKFNDLRRRIGFLSDFLCQEPAKDKTTYYKALISEFGLEGAIKRAASYSYNPIGTHSRNTWNHYQAIIGDCLFTEKVWKDFKKAWEIEL